jgi:A/G-specific adenine glycosylase
VPGIGAYTAGAIASIAYGERAPLVDGNVARVLARVFGVDDDIKSAAGRRRIWSLAGDVMAALPEDAAPGDLNQGLMELGATVCTARSPSCETCPLATAPCVARRDGRQAELPVVAARKRGADLPLIARTALWIADDDGRIVLARRRPGGLFGGLWELPQADDVGAAASEIGVTVTAIGDVVASHRQVLTHRRLAIEVVPARIAPASRLVVPTESGYDAVTWHQPHAAGLGFASSTTAIFAIDKDPSWSSTPKPWPSSSKATRRSSPASRSSATTPATRTSRRPRAARPKRSTSSSTTRSR